jgi:hypothetical protein
MPLGKLKHRQPLITSAISGLIERLGALLEHFGSNEIDSAAKVLKGKQSYGLPSFLHGRR